MSQSPSQFPVMPSAARPVRVRLGPIVLVLGAAMAVSAPLHAQTLKPERERPVGAPQAVGAVHTVRGIPEACTRLEGRFTGDPGAPYRMDVVPAGGSCQPRARYVDPAQAKPSQAGGWILNSLIRVPSAECPGQEAVVQVWRKPVDQAMQLDAQGRVRIYLQDAQKQAATGDMRPLPEFSAVLQVSGDACR